jgi:hypothetical protein
VICRISEEAIREVTKTKTRNVLAAWPLLTTHRKSHTFCVCFDAYKEGVMAHTNRGRVILGGLLAGVVINVVEYVTNGIVLRQAWGQAMQALGKPADLSASAIVIFNVWGFLLGIAAVWIYAAIRPRYGAGPGTAVRAGLAAWALAVFLANLGNYPLGLFPTRLLVITTVVALAEIVVGTLAGAWLYKEKQIEAPAVLRPAA